MSVAIVPAATIPSRPHSDVALTEEQCREWARMPSEDFEAFRAFTASAMARGDADRQIEIALAMTHARLDGQRDLAPEATRAAIDARAARFSEVAPAALTPHLARPRPPRPSVAVQRVARAPRRPHVVRHHRQPRRCSEDEDPPRPIRARLEVVR